MIDLRIEEFLKTLKKSQNQPKMTQNIAIKYKI